MDVVTLTLAKNYTDQMVEDLMEALPEDIAAIGVEVADIRTGFDGTVYETAGEAVRGQVKDLHSDLSSIPEFIRIGGCDEYNLITLATEVSTVEELLAADGIAILKDYEYNGTASPINFDDKYNVLKVPVQAGDVIRSNTVPYWRPTSNGSSWRYVGFFNADGTLLENFNLVFEGHASAKPTYLDIRANGVIAPDGSAYALVNVFRDYWVNDVTSYRNGREASIVTLNADASLTAYDGSELLPDYVSVEKETYYTCTEDLRIARYDDALGDIETILADVVGGVE